MTSALSGAVTSAYLELEPDKKEKSCTCCGSMWQGLHVDSVVYATRLAWMDTALDIAERVSADLGGES